ncbi:hypothetical protein CAP31_03785 [Sulfuriferula sp. AH1]|uniref:hypothetical protein n=1 Tax=Sulfuriferula sp. AH1 TaxID=1985873 RepID=UPI000B3B8FC8|nr:hypothetical protein [Sulfuriferula sp. AH1]ARU30883.1 hypothetical protein CAP31_03785 [Sulfuriferula sp. AH1]
MKFSDLFRDAGTGMLSHTKLWANIGYATLTVAFIKDSWAGGLTDMKIFAYGAVVTGSAAASKLLSMRYGIKPDTKDAANEPGNP